MLSWVFTPRDVGYHISSAGRRLACEARDIFTVSENGRSMQSTPTFRGPRFDRGLCGTLLVWNLRMFLSVASSLHWAGQKVGGWWVVGEEPGSPTNPLEFLKDHIVSPRAVVCLFLFNL